MLRGIWTYVCVLFLGQALLLGDLWINPQCSAHNGGRVLSRYPEDIPDSYDQSVVTLFTFLGWKRKLEPELSLLPHQPCGIRFLPVLTLEGNNYSSTPPVSKTISLKLPILLRFLAPSSIHRLIAHCYTITRLLNTLVLSRQSSIFEDIGA